MSIKKISPSQGYELAKSNILLVDVREENEVKEIAYQVPNIKNIPLSEFSERFHEIPKETEVILACKGGVRSLKACEFLQANGYSKLNNLEGGMLAWKENNLPTK